MPMPPPTGRFSVSPPEPSADYQVLIVEAELPLSEADLLAETEVVPYLDDDRPTLEELVELARAERDLRRAEAHRRWELIASAGEPAPWFASPWARVGACALVGFALGRSRWVRALATAAAGAVLVMSVDRALAHTAHAPASW